MGSRPLKLADFFNRGSDNGRYRLCMARFYVLVLAAGLLTQTFAAPPALTFTYENDSEAEHDTARVLTELLAEYDTARWIRTHKIHVAERATPHSHPVLTLTGRRNPRRQPLLATFLHEQFHWHPIEEAAAGQKAMAEFAKLFPDPPSRQEGGARDNFSTYLHLVVCDLEYQAMEKLVGDERAREILSEWRFYTWIYEKVLNDPRIREVNKANGFVLD